MTAATLRRRPSLSPRRANELRTVAALAVIATATMGLSLAFPVPSVAAAFGGAGVLTLSVWMLASQRYEVTLAILMLYLGLADGYIKLKTNSDVATLGRDVLLYGIALGAILRHIIRRQPIERPPLLGWVILFAGVVLVQLANPGNGTAAHATMALRPHLEFVPLFFLGYATLQSTSRLKGFLILLLTIAAVNGLVALVQFNLSPDQLANWGPGYRERIQEGDAPRAFTDESGEERVRPFALGSDMGFGGSLGLLAGPAALALLAASTRARTRLLAGALAGGAVLGVVTSEARYAVVGAVVAVLAFVVLATAARRSLRTLVSLGIAAVLGVAVISVLADNTDSGAFDRYETITPNRVFGTAYNYRRDTISELPELMGTYPLGAGIGSVGPASDSGDGSGAKPLNAESELNFLVIELGILGLMLVAFQVRVLVAGLGILRRNPNSELRLLLAAMLAGVAALIVAGLVGITTSSVPDAPFFWLTAGAVSYWLGAGRSRPVVGTDRISPLRLPASWAAIPWGQELAQARRRDAATMLDQRRPTRRVR